MRRCGLTILIILLLSGCGGGDAPTGNDDPIATVNENQGADAEKACAALTDETRQALDAFAADVLSPIVESRAGCAELMAFGFLKQIGSSTLPSETPIVDGKVDLLGGERTGWPIRGSAACARYVAASVTTPLPLATRQGLIEDLEAARDRTAELKDALASAQPAAMFTSDRDKVVAAVDAYLKGLTGSISALETGDPLQRAFDAAVVDKASNAIIDELHEAGLFCYSGAPDAEVDGFREQATTACQESSDRVDAIKARGPRRGRQRGREALRGAARARPSLCPQRATSASGRPRSRSSRTPSRATPRPLSAPTRERKWQDRMALWSWRMERGVRPRRDPGLRNSSRPRRGKYVFSVREVGDAAERGTTEICPANRLPSRFLARRVRACAARCPSRASGCRRWRGRPCRCSRPRWHVWVLATVGFVTGAVSPWVTIPVHAATAFLMFTVLHDASHYSISSHRWVNPLFGRLAMPFVVAYSSFPLFAYIHIQHHRHANEDADSDPDHYTSEGAWWSLPFRWLTIDLWYTRYFLRNRKRRPRSASLESGGCWSLFAGVVAACAPRATSGPWRSCA